MGLLDGQTQYEYYNGNDFGSYQFISLEDIITQFQIAYVGEHKIISKVKRSDIAFHAQRGLQEFSFDTFKSIKSQEIEVPATLVMPLPHDYVNYTKISSVDSAGIKHPLYPTKQTSNPFKIKQDDDGSYDFTFPETTLVKKGDFSAGTKVFQSGGDWTKSSPVSTDKIHLVSQKLVFRHGSNAPIPPANTATTSRAYAVYQEIDVSNIDVFDLSAAGTSAAAVTGKGVGTVRVGISTLTYPDYIVLKSNPNIISSPPSLNNTDDPFDVYTTGGARALLTFNDGTGVESSSSITDIDVTNLDTVYVLITSFIENFTDSSLSDSENKVDDVVITCDAQSDFLQTTGDSTAWTNYKAHNPSENTQHDYQDYQNDILWPNEGGRYGLEPFHAQINGSFYIEQRTGRIYFSSNISGETVILDYISDSLGTDGEMQVHKFAEEAMYKYIAYAILSTSANPVHQNLAPRFKRERFAATRLAKLRLSNLKLEELTQMLRGKSKHIKH